MPSIASVRQPIAEDIPSNLRSGIRRKLLRWYDRNKRDLPWRRRQSDPYAQWVAEIMLQQTRVETVIDYYNKFLKRFPTLQDLGRASHAQVLKYWEGLGYYRRILYLHKAAQLLCTEQREIPESVDQLRDLPGVGEYTSAAIASIAFGRAEAAVDGNVERVLARMFAVGESIRTPGGKATIRNYARQLLSRSRPGDFNQAWMDLGSRICTPKSPNCMDCPLRANCEAFQQDNVAAYPNLVTQRDRRPRPVDLVTVILVRDSRFLVQRRQNGGLWSGLWEFPTAEREEGRDDFEIAGRLLENLEISLPDCFRSCGVVTHQLTHRSLRFHTLVGQIGANEPGNAKMGNCRRVSVRGFRGLAVSTAHRKIFEHCRKYLIDAVQIQ